VQQSSTLREIVPGHVWVVAEDGRADHENEVVTAQLGRQRSDSEGKRALELGMVLGKDRTLGRRGRPDWAAEALSE
jgi:hypothetical protein